MYTCTSICVYLWTTWCVLVTWECFCSPGRLPYVSPLFCLTCVREGLTRLLHGAVVYTRSMFSIELGVKELSYDTYPGVLTSLCMPGANLSLMYMPMLFDVMCKSLFVTHITHTKGSSRKCQFLVYVSVFMSLYTVCVCVSALLYGFSLITYTDTSSGCTTSLAKFKLWFQNILCLSSFS